MLNQNELIFRAIDGSTYLRPIRSLWRTIEASLISFFIVSAGILAFAFIIYTFILFAAISN